MWMAFMMTDLPVGGMPFKFWMFMTIGVPKCVAVEVCRDTTTSPSATISSIVVCWSGNVVKCRYGPFGILRVLPDDRDWQRQGRRMLRRHLRRDGSKHPNIA